MIRSAFIALLSVVLASCSSSSSDSGDGANESALTGILVDSAVEGVSFSTPTQSGTTNSTGEFSYINGEQVSFSIGDTVFPLVVGAPQVSPVDMAEGSSNPADTTTNIARLMQSLDADGDPDNGITIPPEAAAVSADINFDVSTEQFENNANVVNMVANSGSINSTLISSEAANQHLNETLGNSGSSGDAPSYRNQIVDGEGQSFVSNNVITLTSTSSDGSRQRNRLIVDTNERLIVDVLSRNPTIESEDGAIQVRVFMTLYNDTVNTEEVTPSNSVGDVTINVTAQLREGQTEFEFYACATRDIEDDQQEIPILNGEICFADSTTLNIGERLTMGIEFDRESGMLSILRNAEKFEFQLSGSFYPPANTSNRFEAVVRGGAGQITTEIYGISSDNFDDDFSNGVTVEGIND